ncbi:protein YdhT [Brenneria tiliae]|uniref:Protein YdhT n=1 Tax=Brenneria tiliae TaxID=2914984 RepID=A0ABT0MR80_9GAMM|nr:protein YdhT [Brenneria tiliae]MCL2892358.1 protein YdhT [Brenneria tiliae]
MNKITRQQLHSLQVSPRIYRWFLRRFPQGGEYQDIHYALLCDGYSEWLESLVEYGYALGFDTPQFMAQEISAARTMVERLTHGGDGVVQVKPRGGKYAANIPREVQLASGDSALDIGCIGLQSKVALSGAYNFMGNSGENSGIASVGYACQLVSTGFAVKISNAGEHCRIGSLGGRARISNSGNSAKISGAGRGTHVANSGMRSYISNAGDGSTIANVGDMCKLGAAGDESRISNSGDNVSITVTGGNAVVTSSGSVNTLVLGKGGCAALTYHDGERTRFLVVYEGENGVVAGVKYRLNASFELEACG